MALELVKSEADAEAAAPVTPDASAEADFLTTEQLQKILPLSRRTIYEWRRKGVLPSIEIGSKILFHRKSVESALLRHQRNGGAH